MHFDGDVNDSSGNALHGTWQGSEQYAPGSIGQSIDLSVSDNNYVIVDNDDRLGGMEQLTVSVWAKKNNPDIGGTLIVKHGQYSISIGRNYVSSYVGNEAGVMGRANKYSMNSINDTEWHNYALSYNGSLVELFVDGVMTADAPLSGIVRVNSGHNLYIGKNRWGDAFEGQIDELLISTEEFNLDIPPAMKRVADDSMNLQYPLLSQNYPNPFNNSTIIEFQIPGLGGENNKANVQLGIYNIYGQCVKELISSYKSPGRYSVIWDGLDNNGSEVAAGLYIYHISIENFKTTKKMLFIK
jgi:hypothetical protein